jgi:pyruvate dehydrogenase E2 component (dihydrolipoamide acetyltransferase)
MFHVRFADIGEGIHEGVLLKLFFNEGDAVKDGDSLFTLETDKVNAEIPSPVSGILKTNRFKVGAKVHVGDVIVIVDDGVPGARSNMPGEPLVEEGDAASAAMPAEQTAPPPGVVSQVSESKPPTAAQAPATEGQKETILDESVQLATVEEKGSTAVVGQIEISSNMIPSSGEATTTAEVAEVGARILATPVARKMAKDLGVDIQKIVGTGPQGRVMKADIAEAAKATATVGSGAGAADASATAQSKETSEAPSRSVDFGKHTVPTLDRSERVPMSMHRKAIANNMTLSKFTIPHTAVMDEIDVTDLVAFRTSSKALAEEEGVKLTYLAFFIKAVVSGLKQFPGLNASIDEVAEEIVYKHFYNIGLAVDTPEGLMVPVIKDADTKSIFELAKAIEDLSVRARSKTLKLDELSGGSFTITNYGSVGASFGVPVIKHPEAGILGVGAIVKKPVVIDDEIVIRSILPVSLSFDHRIIDGADAGRFVGYIKKSLSNPNLLLML